MTTTREKRLIVSIRNISEEVNFNLSTLLSNISFI